MNPGPGVLVVEFVAVTGDGGLSMVLAELETRSTTEVVVVAATIEAELAQLDAEDAELFRQDAGIGEPAVVASITSRSSTYRSIQPPGSSTSREPAARSSTGPGSGGSWGSPSSSQRSSIPPGGPKRDPQQ